MADQKENISESKGRFGSPLDFTIRIDKEENDNIEAFMVSEGHKTKSEAVRRLLRMGFEYYNIGKAHMESLKNNSTPLIS